MEQNKYVNICLFCIIQQMPKNWCFWTMVLAKTLESPLGCKEIKPDNPKGNQPWTLLKGLMLRQVPITLATWCEEPTLWKRPWYWDKYRWTRWLDGITDLMEQASGDGEGQGSLACCSPWGCKGWTQLSDWTTTKIFICFVLYSKCYLKI